MRWGVFEGLRGRDGVVGGVGERVEGWMGNDLDGGFVFNALRLMLFFLLAFNAQSHPIPSIQNSFLFFFSKFK